MPASYFSDAVRAFIRRFVGAMTTSRGPLRCTFLIAVLSASVASCNGSPEREDTGRELSSSEPTRVVTSLEDIRGFWLVERFEDFEPSWRNKTPWRSAFVQIGDGILTYEIGCNRSGNPAALDRNGILRDTGDGSRMQTLQGCGDVREARDGRFFSFFGSNPRVREFGEDRILLQHGERELVLVRPDRWRQIHKPEFTEIEGRWVPQMSTTYDGWGSSGFGIGDDPGVVTIGRRHIAWSLCPNLPVPIRWTSDALLAATTAIDITDCSAVARATENGPGAVMSMLTANPAVIRTGPDRIVLVDGTGEKGRRIDFRSEESVLDPPPPPPPPEGYEPPPIPPSPPIPDNGRTG